MRLLIQTSRQHKGDEVDYISETISRKWSELEKTTEEENQEEPQFALLCSGSTVWIQAFWKLVFRMAKAAWGKAQCPWRCLAEVGRPSAVPQCHTCTMHGQWPEWPAVSTQIANSTVSLWKQREKCNFKPSGSCRLFLKMCPNDF